MPVFDYLKAHPQEAEYFNDAMMGLNGPEFQAVAKAYDFSGIGTLVDIGGGTGNFMATLLRASPGLKGIVFDLPHVAASCEARLKQLGLSDRCRVVGGA